MERTWLMENAAQRQCKTGNLEHSHSLKYGHILQFVIFTSSIHPEITNQSRELQNLSLKMCIVMPYIYNDDNCRQCPDYSH